MSNEAITWAYRQTMPSPGAKFVLVALADMADENDSCYPGQRRLAIMTGQSERTVRRELAELELAGLIVRTRRFDVAGHRTSDRYVLPVNQKIPTGQSDHRSNKPPVTVTTGQDDHRPPEDGLPATRGRPTGQSDQVTQREPSSNPQRSRREKRADVERLCSLLADRIAENDEDRKRPTVTKKWRDAARLLIDKDGRSEENIAKAIDWCQDSEFWRGNILSMPTLREKYPTLQAQAKRDQAEKPRRPVADDAGWMHSMPGGAS